MIEIPAMTARRVSSFDELRRRGDYFLGTIDDHGTVKRMVWFLLPLHEGWDLFDRATPASGLHGVTEPPWTIRECPDGSVEIRASIACGRGTADGEYFHGYLDEGNRWRLA